MTLAVLAVQVVICIFTTIAFSQESSKPQDLIQAAHDAGSLSKVGPYELRADLIAYDQKSKSVTGHIKILGDGAKARIEFQLGRYHEVRISQPGMEYILRSVDYEPAEIHFLSGLDRAWDPIPRNPTGDFYRFSHISKKKVHGLDAICLREKQKFFGERLLCFDSARHVPVRENFQHDEQIEFLDYVPIDPGLLFPRKIGIYRSDKPVLEIKNIEIEKKNLSEDVFVASPQSIEIERCDKPTAPKLLSTAEPDFSEMQQSAKAALYVIVDKDGSILTAHEADGANMKDDDFFERSQSAIRRWRFSPATCGGHPVAIEVLIETNLMRDQ